MRLALPALLAAGALGLSGLRQLAPPTPPRPRPSPSKAGDDSCDVSPHRARGRHATLLHRATSGPRPPRSTSTPRATGSWPRRRTSAPGLSYDLTAQVPARLLRRRLQARPGRRRHPHPGHGRRAAGAPTTDSAAAQAVADYRTYVQGQVDALVPLVDGLRRRGQGRRRRAGQGAVRPVAGAVGARRAGRRGLRRPRPRDGRSRGRPRARARTGPAGTASRRRSGSTAAPRGWRRSPTGSSTHVAELQEPGRDRRPDDRRRSATAPRSCSTRSPPARSPARRRPSRTPTWSTSPRTSDGARAGLRGRCGRSCEASTPALAAQLDAAFADVERRARRRTPRARLRLLRHRRRRRPPRAGPGRRRARRAAVAAGRGRHA